MPKQEILKDVPASELEDLKSDYESKGAKVTCEEQPDGTFTVTAMVPDKKKS